MPSIVEGLNKPAGLTIAEALGGEKGMPISEVVKEHGGGGGDVVIMLLDEYFHNPVQFIHTTKGTRTKMPLPENISEEMKSELMYMAYNDYISFVLENHREPTKYDHAVDYLPFDGDLMYTASKDVLLYVTDKDTIRDLYIEFDPNGGTLARERNRYLSFNIGADAYPVDVIPPEGQELFGWGYEPDATTLINFPLTVSDHPITIYAIYQDIQPQEQTH